MDYNDIIYTRYSVRKFSDRPVEKNKLNKILEAGRIAPTAGNRQPQRIVVIQGGDAFEKMKLCTPCHFNAPLLLLVCYDQSVENNNHYGDKRPYGQVDASIVLTHMMLEAHNLGLGTVWVGLFNPDLLRENFNIPAHYEILSLMPIGYPAPEAEPSSMHNQKFDLTHTVFYCSFKKEIN